MLRSAVQPFQASQLHLQLFLFEVVFVQFCTVICPRETCRWVTVGSKTYLSLVCSVYRILSKMQRSCAGPSDYILQSQFMTGTDQIYLTCSRFKDHCRDFSAFVLLGNKITQLFVYCLLCKSKAQENGSTFLKLVHFVTFENINAYL